MDRRPFVVRRKWETAEDICGLELVPEDGTGLSDIEPGAHVEFVYIHAGLDAAQTRRVLEELLQRPAAGAHAYCCGPGVFIDAVEAMASSRWPEERLHFERFQADAKLQAQPEEAFTVVLRKSGISCRVEAGQTIIGVLAQAGCELETSCEQGVCGTCLTRVLEGTPDHRDAYLSKAEQQGNTQMLPCVSRSLTPVIVLDR